MNMLRRFVCFQEKTNKNGVSNVESVYSDQFRVEEVKSMKIIEVEDRNPVLVEQLLNVWESSVKATHLFLSDDEIMLFISNESRGQGIGKQLLQYGIENYSINELAVNEQNPLARGFYEHMGFEAYKRTELDEQGNPYPLLYMKRDL